jgi:HSP20 family molecular chaperone IbpA
MWEKARELFERADKLHRHFFQLGRPRYQRPTWEPPIDVFETEVEVLIEGTTLTITGERNMPSQCEKSRVHRLEIPHGRFERQVELPAGHYEVGARDLVNGCLFLSLRKVS